MSYNLVTSSVNPSAFPTTYNVNTSHPKKETASTAINIGNLQEENSTVTVSDAGAVAGTAVSTSFVAQAGDVTSLNQAFTNFVDQVDAHYQLFDSANNLIADNQGSAAQQEAFTAWQNGTLSLNSGTYTAIATPNAASTNGLAISTVQNQGTSLEVNSQLTGGDPTEYYNFSLSSGNNLKLALDAGSQTSSTRVQLLNSSGAVVADSAGNPFEQANYQALTSGTGLTASTGNYTVAVTYANGVDNTPNINYNLQLYSGTNYAVVYNNNVKAQPTDNTATGSVTATSTAQAYSRQAFNSINPTAASAVNIGWLQQDKSSLDVYSQLTSADSADLYSFTLQQGDNLKFGFTSATNASDLRVQVLNSTGTQVIADSNGTPAQQAAYKELTTTNGLPATPGGYTIKVSYAPNATKTSQTYEFGVFSGTSYAAQYKTIASAQTYANALASGSITGTAAASGIASYLTALSQGGDTSSALTNALKALV